MENKMLELLKTRRSVRRYQPVPVEREKLERIMNNLKRTIKD